MDNVLGNILNVIVFFLFSLNIFANLISRCELYFICLYFSVSTRMAWAITILLVSFVSLTVLSIPDSDMWQEKFLHAVILTIVASNVGVNVLQVKINLLSS